MIIKTELTDENPSHWPSSIVPNTSLSVYFIWALTRAGDWRKAHMWRWDSGGFWEKELS